MNDHDMYKEMIIYWSSDYSSAMFANLPTDKKVFVVASAEATQT